MSKKVGKKYYIALWLMILTYILVNASSLAMRYYSFDFYDMDLAYFDQVIWQIPQGDFINSIVDLHFLGVHGHFLAFPLALIYMLAPHPLTLLFIQTIVMALGAYPLFLIALRVLVAPLALLVSTCYLLYPGLIFTNAYEFHYPPLAILSLLYACYFYFENRYRPYLIAIVLTLLVQENLSLVVFAFGLYAMTQRRSRKWWLPLMISSAVYFIFCIKFMLPTLNQNVIQFMSIYEYFGKSYTEIIINILSHPVRTLAYMFTHDKLWWLFQLFIPLLFIPLAAPGHMLPIVFIFLQRLLSSRQQEIDITFHYTSELIPFIFLAFIYGLRRVSSLKFLNARRPVLIGSVLCVALWAGLSTRAFTRILKPFYFGIDNTDTVREEMIKYVPANAALVTTFQFMPHLNHRKDFYSFHHFYTMKYMLSQKDYVYPPRVDFALIDFNDPLTIGSFYDPLGYENILEFINHYKLSPILVKDNTILFQSGVRPKISLFKIANEATSDNGLNPLFEYDGIQLVSASAQMLDQKTVKIEMNWEAQHTTQHDINLYFRLVDAAGQERLHVTSTVCYRIFPTQAWRAGQHIIDFRYLTVPPHLWNQALAVKIGFYDQDGFTTLGKEVFLKIAGTKEAAVK